jgi:putative serine protease PepD
MSENESRPGPASTGGYPPLQPPQHPAYAPYYGYQQQPLPPHQPVNPLYQQQLPAPKPPRGRRVALLVGSTALAAALIGGVSGAVIATADAPPATTTSAVTANTQAQNTSLTGVAGVASKVLPSVVQINTTTGQQGGEIGSGVILTSDGRILTNAHVVSGAVSVTVTLSDGTKYSGSVVGADTKNDLAVIQLKNAKGLTAATLADSSKVGVGDAVVAIGSPGGLQNTVTSGIVSALNRSLADVGGQQQQQQQQFNNTSDTTSNAGNYSGLIQTDASINQGNSGGALVNAAGQVIGINSVIYSPVHGADGSAGSVGIGFAIPINTAKTIVAQIVGG